jgi:hypothetical protein
LAAPAPVTAAAVAPSFVVALPLPGMNWREPPLGPEANLFRSGLGPPDAGALRRGMPQGRPAWQRAEDDATWHRAFDRDFAEARMEWVGEERIPEMERGVDVGLKRSDRRRKR